MKQLKIILATLIVIMASSILLVGSQTADDVSSWSMSYVKTVVRDYFDSDPAKVRMEPLLGGYSNAENMKLEIDGKAYVLRVISGYESPNKRDGELFAFKEASAAGIAPNIHWTSPDGHGILMDYIAGETLTIEKGKDPEVAFKIANLMRMVHALPKNPFHAPSFETVMEEHYKLHSPGDSNQTIWKDAIAIVKEGTLQLRNLNAPSVNTHGDLNPRNILLLDQEIYFIDWSDGLYTDPFHDLAYFSMMMDYDSNEELFFLQCYLGHVPTPIEKKRFRIAKKMCYARLTLSCQGIGNHLSRPQKEEAQALEPPKDLSYYAHKFANNKSPLTAKYFLELAQLALESAKALDVHDANE